METGELQKSKLQHLYKILADIDQEQRKAEKELRNLERRWEERKKSEEENNGKGNSTVSIKERDEEWTLGLRTGKS